MSNINQIIYESLSGCACSKTKDPDSIFDNTKENENAKYTPSFLDKVKKIQKNVLMDLDIRNLFKINPKTIKGTNISIDANNEEREADRIMRKDGLMK